MPELILARRIGRYGQASQPHRSIQGRPCSSVVTALENVHVDGGYDILG